MAMLSSYATGTKPQRLDRFGMDASRPQHDASICNNLEKKVFELTQLIQGTQCLVDEIQQSHSRGLGLLKCRIDRLEVSHRSFVENWENSMRKIVTEHFKSHETQYRCFESRVMSRLRDGLSEFKNARSSMENSRTCFQGTIEQICMQTGCQLEELEERISDFEDNVVDSINRISHQTGLCLLDADTVKRKLGHVEVAVAKISGCEEIPLSQGRDGYKASGTKHRRPRPQRDHPRRYKVQVAPPQAEPCECSDMDLIIARMSSKKEAQRQNYNVVDETLQDRVGQRFEKSFLSVQEKLNGMHDTFDGVRETLGSMKEPILVGQAVKPLKDILPERSPLRIKIPRDQNHLEVDVLPTENSVYEGKSNFRVEESDIVTANIFSDARQICRENPRMEIKGGFEETHSCSRIIDLQSHPHREVLQVGSSRGNAVGERKGLIEKQERQLSSHRSGKSSSQSLGNDALVMVNPAFHVQSERGLLCEAGCTSVKENRKANLHGFNNNGKPITTKTDDREPDYGRRHGEKLLKLYSELRELND